MNSYEERKRTIENVKDLLESLWVQNLILLCLFITKSIIDYTREEVFTYE